MSEDVSIGEILHESLDERQGFVEVGLEERTKG